jgi:AraC-like DNA-binding protein
MLEWRVQFEILRPLQSFPVPVILEMETQYSSAYRTGKGRTFNGLFVYTMSGRGCFQEGDKVYDLLPGTAYVCCGEEPDVCYYYPSDSTEPWTFFWFSFIGDGAESMLQNLIDSYGRIYRIPDTHRALRNLLNLRNGDISTRNLSPHEGGGLVFDLLLAMAEVFEQPDRGLQTDGLIQRAQQFIIKNLRDLPSCDAVAGKMNMSREHLSRLFKKHTGLTLREFINKRLMLEACHLLKETDMSSKEIAAVLGYEKSSNFIRAFKQHQKITPGEFRRSGSIPRL